MSTKNASSLNIEELTCFKFYSGWREIEQLFRKIVGNDMTLQKSFVLSYLYDENRSMTEVSKHLNLDSSAVSTLVDRMFKKGLIHRIRSDTDKRIILVGLTDEGKTLKSELDDKVNLFMKISSEEITAEEQIKLGEIVSRIKNNHGKLSDKTSKAA